MKIAFFGTPEFAVPSLLAVLGSRHEVVCVVAQPDKPSGRGGGSVVVGAVKRCAMERGVAVLQPEKISKEVEILGAYKPNIIVTCAFGQILKQNVLDYPKHGVINVHASLLPKYRGSSPIQWAIINGETKTGVTIMQTDIGLDTGDIILMRELGIGKCETAGELFPRLAELGARALIEALDIIENGTAVRTPQNHDDATKFPMLNKDMAQLDFNKTAVELVNFVRGLNPWPVAWVGFGGETLRVFRASAMENGYTNARELLFPCADGVLRVDELQPPNKKRMTARDYLNGRRA